MDLSDARATSERRGRDLLPETGGVATGALPGSLLGSPGEIAP
jgi:hypothetical protein